LLQTVLPVAEALSAELADQGQHRSARDRFRRSCALGCGGRWTQLACPDPLRIPAPGADDPRQPGTAGVAPRAARARLDRQLPPYRHAVPDLPCLAPIRAGADAFPAAADLVASGFGAGRVAGGLGRAAVLYPVMGRRFSDRHYRR